MEQPHLAVVSTRQQTRQQTNGSHTFMPGHTDSMRNIDLEDSSSASVHVQNQEIHITNYVLNKEKCLNKKLKACDRANYSTEMNNFSANVLFNTASYEVFRRALAHFYSNSSDYEIRGKPLVDQASNIAQEVIRVHDRNKRNKPHVYTLNMYNTKSSLMVNGPHHLHFIDNDLPAITKVIDQVQDNIEEMNAGIKLSLNNNNQSLPVADTQTTSSNRVAIEPEILDTKDNEPAQNEEEFETEVVLPQCYCLKQDTDNMIQCDGCGKWIRNISNSSNRY